MNYAIIRYYNNLPDKLKVYTFIIMHNTISQSIYFPPWYRIIASHRSLPRFLRSHDQFPSPSPHEKHQKHPFPYLRLPAMPQSIQQTLSLLVHCRPINPHHLMHLRYTFHIPHTSKFNTSRHFRLTYELTYPFKFSLILQEIAVLCSPGHFPFHSPFSNPLKQKKPGKPHIPRPPGKK